MGKTLNISTNLWKSIKNSETHLKTFAKQWQMIEINMSNNENGWNNLKQHCKKQWNTLTESMKILKSIENNNGNIEKHWEQWKLMKITLTKTTMKNHENIENTMETNVKIIHRLILSWSPFEAHLRFRWGYFESPLRLLLTASLDLYINLLLNWFWKNLRVSLKTTKKHVRPTWVNFTKNRNIRWAIEWKLSPVSGCFELCSRVLWGSFKFWTHFEGLHIQEHGKNNDK